MKKHWLARAGPFQLWPARAGPVQNKKNSVKLGKARWQVSEQRNSVHKLGKKPKSDAPKVLRSGATLGDTGRPATRRLLFLFFFLFFFFFFFFFCCSSSSSSSSSSFTCRRLGKTPFRATPSRLPSFVAIRFTGSILRLDFKVSTGLIRSQRVSWAFSWVSLDFRGLFVLFFFYVCWAFSWADYILPVFAIFCKVSSGCQWF